MKVRTQVKGPEKQDSPRCYDFCLWPDSDLLRRVFQGPLSGAKRTRYAQSEVYRF
jgi:hypothetical protein